MKLKHKDGKDYGFSNVTVTYDNKIDHLAVDEEGCVTVSNKKQAEELAESHGGFEVVEEGNVPDYVLQEMNVSEVEHYLRDVNDLERLNELRRLESEHKNRRTALDVIDSRIAEVKPEPEDVEDEKQEENDETLEEDEEENGEETEDE